ncbi:MAG: pilus assembly protein CpaE [Alphaproteobacteria bacterium]|nr:MAG: pilus assembly protein CpaE [Alphaproteobacteria bacterium]
MNSVSGNTVERELYAAYLCDEMTGQIMLPIISERGWAPDRIFSGGIAAAVRALGAMPCPEFLIVDLSDSSDPRADMQALADVCEEGTIVLALGSVNDVTLYRDLLHAGVHDYLVKPVTADLLRAAIGAVEDTMAHVADAPEQVQQGEGKQIVFVGVRGGMGTSTLACNSAWLSANQGRDTVLLDLDLYFGIAAMQFDLEPGRGLPDALDTPGRVDGLFLERAVVKPHKNLSILAAEAPMGSIREPAEGALAHLVEALAENYGTVVVDVPRQLLGEHSDVLAAATDVVLVTDYSLTAARDCIRLMAHIKQVAPNAKVHLVANKVGAQPHEVDEKDFENSVEHAIDIRVPLDAKTLLSAAQKGKVVAEVAPGSKLGAAMRDLNALMLGSKSGGEARKSWLGKLLKK